MVNKIIDDEYEFDDELENDNENTVEDSQDDQDYDSDYVDSEIIISDDEEDINIVIEIEDEDDIINDEEDNFEEITELDDDIVFSKHKIEGKHSLKYDIIFKGKKEETLDEEDVDAYSTGYIKENIELDKSSNYYFESVDNENYIRSKLVKEKVYFVLSQHTSINFLNNRRKPSRSDFNQYYALLKTHLASENFTNIELFNELAFYFSDNLFNMFKLLDNKWRNLIIMELQEHIGKISKSKDITNRNIYDGTEIEFTWIDHAGKEKSITGVVVESDYENSIFKVDSYENIYEISINQITKILNNTKFKYNLNKLNNIDFL
jgi:hypothetical protein